jgi:hypothetical protein
MAATEGTHVSDAAPNDSDHPSVERTGHVAVVFFHGMGQQRHYQSVSMLVETLETYARSLTSGPKNIWNTKIRREKLTGGATDADAECVCIQADYGRSRVRFYEAYWAPAATEGTSAISVFWWLISQIQRPLMVLSAPWRSFSRLRRADLLRLRTPQSEAASEVGSNLFGRLCKLYDSFVQQRGDDVGTFNQFRGFLDEKTEGDSDQKELTELALKWRSSSWWLELGRAALLVGIGLTVALAAVLLGFGVFWVLQTAAKWIPLVPASMRGAIEPAVEPTITNILALIAILFGLLGVTGFLKDSVGDVQQFVTYQETEPLHKRRDEILSAAESTLRHALATPGVERVVIVGHSLGTAVALDTLLNLRASNQANNPGADGDAVMHGPVRLDLIQHFVTSGSPIDKVNYFFATFKTTDYSYERMIDWLRGDLGDVPFSKSGRQPYVHWVNFWDRGDVISGSLETVESPYVRDQRVDNVRIASYAMPDPVGSHSAYFVNDLYRKTVFDIAFSDELSFANPPHAQNGHPVYEWVGPGTGSGAQSRLLALYALVPVAAAFALVAALGFAPLAIALPALGLVAVLFLAAGWQHRHKPS